MEVDDSGIRILKIAFETQSNLYRRVLFFGSVVTDF